MFGSWRRRSAVSWLVLACSLLLTLLAWDVSARSVRGRLRDQFTLRTDKVVRAIEQRMSAYEDVLRGGVALFMASRLVTRQEFADFFRYLDVRRTHPGIQGVGFAVRVRDEELASFVDEVRAEGFPRFSVLPTGRRPLYTPVVYIEPFDRRNQRAFGYDMYSDPSRRAAMDRAAELGRASASGIVTLMQDDHENAQSGFLFYVPIVRRAPRVPALAPEPVFGYVYGAFRVHDLMQGVLSEDGSSDLDFALYEDGSPTSFFDTRTQGTQQSELSRRRTLEVGGRAWTLRFWSRPAFGRTISRHEPLWVLLGGVAINLLLFYIVGSATSLQRRANAMAHRMTEALTLSHAREQSQMRAALREKETLLKEIHHRVKNNLQVVSSLLSLQQSHTEDPRALDALQQSRDRVLAMASLHEFLYQSKDLSRVDTRAYLSHLVSVLVESYRLGTRVEVTLAIEDVPLDLDQAIPCGLIINELVTNALKYAFRDERTGHLTVSLREEGDSMALQVADDGVGLPPSVDGATPTTLGLQLVQLLGEQLGGVVHISREVGTSFLVTFRRSAQVTS